jgi:PhnB protein
MAKLNPYLTFEGNCREAMTFYRDCFGGELKIMTVGESPAAAGMPKESHGDVMHARLESGPIVLMASDRLSPEKAVMGNCDALLVDCASGEEIESLFGKLSRGGVVNSALKKEFWGATYGDITDRFSFRWMLNYEAQKT